MFICFYCSLFSASVANPLLGNRRIGLPPMTPIVIEQSVLDLVPSPSILTPHTKSDRDTDSAPGSGSNSAEHQRLSVSTVPRPSLCGPLTPHLTFKSFPPSQSFPDLSSPQPIQAAQSADMFQILKGGLDQLEQCTNQGFTIRGFSQDPDMLLEFYKSQVEHRYVLTGLYEYITNIQCTNSETSDCMQESVRTAQVRRYVDNQIQNLKRIKEEVENLGLKMRHLKIGEQRNHNKKALGRPDFSLLLSSMTSSQFGAYYVDFQSFTYWISTIGSGLWILYRLIPYIRNLNIPVLNKFECFQIFNVAILAEEIKASDKRIHGILNEESSDDLFHTIVLDLLEFHRLLQIPGSLPHTRLALRVKGLQGGNIQGHAEVDEKLV